MKIVLATSNQHKVEELRSLFATHGLEVDLVRSSDVIGPLDIEETGHTFEENAYIKAAAVYDRCGLPTLADDSGLEVDILDGAPGVRSARFAGPSATDADNRAHLVSIFNTRQVPRSPASFRCVLCYIDPLRTLFGVGSSQGAIQTHERGTNGFGYDPLFIPDGETRTYAEMSPTEKQSRSHRGRAVEDLARHLAPLIMNLGHAVEPDPLPALDALIMASVAAVLDQQEHLRTAIRLFVRTVDDARMMYEALLQSYLFAGFPVALDALTTLDEELRTILPDRSTAAADGYDLDLFRQRGAVLCGQIYEGVYDKMMERLTTITPELSDWMIVEGYGKTLSRDGLSVPMRELCNVAVLAVLGRQNQLTSHVRGALRVGATKEQLWSCANAVTEWAGPVAGEQLRTTIERYAS